MGRASREGGDAEIRTLGDILTRLDQRYRKDALLRYKSGGAWKDIPTQEFISTVRSLGLGLAALGIRKGDRVAILSENRPEWTAFDHAILNIGAVNVPIYPTLLTDQVRFILENSQARALIVSTEAQLAKVLPIRQALAGLEHLVILDAPGGAAASDCERRRMARMRASNSRLPKGFTT